MHEDVIKGRDDAGGLYKWEGGCRRTGQKGGIIHKDSIKWGEGEMVHEDITKGRDGAEGGYYKMEECRRTL